MHFACFFVSSLRPVMLARPLLDTQTGESFPSPHLSRRSRAILRCEAIGQREATTNGRCACRPTPAGNSTRAGLLLLGEETQGAVMNPNEQKPGQQGGQQGGQGGQQGGGGQPKPGQQGQEPGQGGQHGGQQKPGQGGQQGGQR